MLPQIVASGLSSGSIYALVALALVITYKTTEVPNFAQGEMAMFSAFIAYVLIVDYNVGFVVAFGAAIVFAFLLGIGFEGLFLRRTKNPTHLNLIIMTLGFQLALFGLAGWRWGADQRQFPFPVSASEVVRFGSVTVSTLSLATISIALVLMAAVFAFFRFTKLGVAMQATQQDPMGPDFKYLRDATPARLVSKLSSRLSAINNRHSGSSQNTSDTLSHWSHRPQDSREVGA